MYLKPSLKLTPNRCGTSLERSLRRSAYIPKKTEKNEIEHILKKYLKIDTSCPLQVRSSPDSSLQKTRMPKTEDSLSINFSYSGIPKKSSLCNNPLSLKIRRYHSRSKNATNDSSLIIKKCNFPKSISISSKKPRKRSIQRFKNSNYTSYSDIYKVLIEKIPLNQNKESSLPYK